MMRRNHLWTLVAGMAALTVGAAPAAAEKTPIEDDSAAGVFVAAKLGAGFGQVLGDLGTTFLGELELGYTLPVPEPVDWDLRLFLAGQYSGPGDEGSGPADPRLPEGTTADYELTQQQARLTFGISYRIPVPSASFRPYLAAGARVYLLKTEMKGSAGPEPFGTYEETDTTFGPYGALGGELYLGPGALLLEIQAANATFQTTIFDGASGASLDVLAGYRLFL